MNPEVPFITMENVSELRETLQRNLNPPKESKTITGPNGRNYKTYAQLKAANPGMPATIDIYNSAVLKSHYNTAGENQKQTDGKFEVYVGMELWRKDSGAKLKVVECSSKVLTLQNKALLYAIRKDVVHVNFTNIDPNQKPTKRKSKYFERELTVGNYLAMSADGLWIEYLGKPDICNGNWFGVVYNTHKPTLDYLALLKFDDISWQDSLYLVPPEGCEWGPIKQDKPKVPKFAYEIPVGNYIVMDKCKRWWQFIAQPKVVSNAWVTFNEDFISCDYVGGSVDRETEPWPNWKDSLFLMTENGLIKIEENEP